MSKNTNGELRAFLKAEKPEGEMIWDSSTGTITFKGSNFIDVDGPEGIRI